MGYSLSSIITNVDPAVGSGSLAELSRSYGVAAQNIFKNTLSPSPVGSYNAELIKQVRASVPPGHGGGVDPAPVLTPSGPAGQASVSIKTNELGQTIAPYTIQTTPLSPIAVTVMIPQSTRSLAANGQPLDKVTVTPLSAGDIAVITGGATPDGAVFTAGGLGTECTPSGATFDHSVSITFSLSKVQWAAALEQAGGRTDALTVQYYDTVTKSWISLPTTAAGSTSRSVTATTNHFSLFALSVKNATLPDTPEPTNLRGRPTPAAGVHTTVPVLTTGTPVPELPNSSLRVPVATLIVIIAGIAAITGGFSS